MELLERILRRVKGIKKTFDLEEKPLVLANEFVQLKRQVAELRSQLGEIQKLSREKDALIAQLQTVAIIKDNVIMDGSAYFIRKNSDVWDGPFCTHCFGKNQENVRIVPAAKPKSASGDPSEWAQCLKCQKPFRSKRVAEYLASSCKLQGAASWEGKKEPLGKTATKGRARRRPTRARRTNSR